MDQIGSPATTIYFSSKKAKRAAANVHFIAGVGLLFTGVENFLSGTHVGLAAVEVLTGFLLVLGVILERYLPHAHVEKYEWILDVLAGCVAVVEGVSKMHGQFRPIVGAYWLAGTLFFALAYFRPQLKKRRYVRLSESEMVLRKHPLLPESVVKWSDVASIDIAEKITVSTDAKSEFVIDLGDVPDPKELREAFNAQRLILFPETVSEYSADA